MRKWESKQYNLSRAIEKMEESKKPKSEIDSKVAELEATKSQLKVKWILDLRDQLQNPQGKLTITIPFLRLFLSDMN